MSKDYKSFSSVAKSRFRSMAKELGYEQITGICYLKERDGWYEGFSLQASSWGNDFFYINYGVSVPNLWSPFKKEIDKKNMGYWLHHRLHSDHDQGFPNATKEQVEKSADIALARYQEQAVPWFQEIDGLKDIAERYFLTTNLDKNMLGEHEHYLGLAAANYGLFLFKVGNNKEALKWLREADRLYSLPVYSTRDGRIVHEREKYSRIVKPEDYEKEQLETIKQIASQIENA